MQQADEKKIIEKGKDKFTTSALKRDKMKKLAKKPKERMFPTADEFLATVPILQFEGYLADFGRNVKDWGADGISHFALLLGISTKSLECELIGDGDKSEWKIQVTVEQIDTGYQEMAVITQARQIQKTNYQTKEKSEEDDPFSLEKASGRAIRNAKKRAMPSKVLLTMLFEAQTARDEARTELRNKMGAYKELGITPRDLIVFAEKKLGREQSEWQAKQWIEFKNGITEGATKENIFFGDLIKSKSGDPEPENIEELSTEPDTIDSDVTPNDDDDTTDNSIDNEVTSNKVTSNEVTSQAEAEGTQASLIPDSYE